MRVNIVIRTLNEGKWLPLCISSLERQSYKDFHVTIVDSGSIDNTLEIAGNYRRVEKSLIEITEYKPGKAINVGAKSHNSEFIVLLSAHCIPINEDWLSFLVSYLDENLDVAAAYGRQVPLNFTGPDDARDLAYTFRGETSKTTSPFFHNANSIMRSGVWQSIPFDESVNHIEDMIWAQRLSNLDYKIGYVKEAAVSHYHGINQHGSYSSFRSHKLIELLLELDIYDQVEFDDLCLGLNLNFATVMIGQPNLYDLTAFKLEPTATFKNKVNASEISDYRSDMSLAELLFAIAKSVSRSNISVIQIIDTSHKIIDQKLTDNAKETFLKTFPDAVITCWRDSGNYLIASENSIDIVQNNNDLGRNKNKMHRMVIGQGSMLCVSELIKNKGEIKSGVLVSSEDANILARRYV